MARPRDPEKRKAILEATIAEIADAGLSAATAKIARRAGIAEGTLFTYFATKDELFNAVYTELKQDIYARINADYPTRSAVKQKAWHVWSTSIAWGIESPERRRASIQLGLSGVLLPETVSRLAAEKALIDALFAELSQRRSLEGLPAGYASSLMAAMQDATIETLMQQPRQRKALVERGFDLYWKAVS